MENGRGHRDAEDETCRQYNALRSGEGGWRSAESSPTRDNAQEVSMLILNRVSTAAHLPYSSLDVYTMCSDMIKGRRSTD